VSPPIPVKLRFDCPVCEQPGWADLPEAPGGAPQEAGITWSCPRCEHVVTLPARVDPALPRCAFCGNGELYKKKDFPHGLGLAILGLAFLASTITYFFYNNYLTWGILIGSAAFDGVLYLLVKDAIVCYRCGAHHRGVPSEHHRPFELTTHERYRQEQLRKDSYSGIQEEKMPSRKRQT
jgi:uncharacterized protein (DUF983 family)